MLRHRRSLLAALLIAAALGVSGCSTTVSMVPAAEANDPACADVTVRLPDSVDGQDRQWTDAQATGAWGSPSAVLLTCGVTPPGPSTLPCQTVNGVDWLVDDAEAPSYRFTTFGRTPAVEVFVDSDVVSGFESLQALSGAVGTLPSDGSACTDRPSS